MAAALDVALAEDPMTKFTQFWCCRTCHSSWITTSDKSMADLNNSPVACPYLIWHPEKKV